MDAFKVTKNTLKEKRCNLGLRYNHIVLVFYTNATLSNCGKPLRVFTTTLYRKLYRGTRLIAVPNGKNVKNWAIRSQAPKVFEFEKFKHYGEGSETIWKWVGFDNPA